MDNKEVIKILKSFLESEIADGDKVAIYEQDLEAFKIAIEALKKQEAEKEKSGKDINIPAKWIPVSERLPEERTTVLIYCPERKNIYCAYYEEKHWWIFGAHFERVEFYVIAWMPLPEPYAESEVKE